MAAIFKPQTEAEIRAALASKCNIIPDPSLKAACLKLAATGPITEKPAVPRWAIGLGAAAAAYVLWRALR